MPTITEIQQLLSGDESSPERDAASRKLDIICARYPDTPEALEALKLLREIRAEEETERRKNEADKPDAERVDREQVAASKLRLARVFIDSRKSGHAEKWLKDVIDTYPETDAAKEAVKLLAQL